MDSRSWYEKEVERLEQENEDLLDKIEALQNELEEAKDALTQWREDYDSFLRHGRWTREEWL